MTSNETEWENLSLEEIEAWADEVDAFVIDQRDEEDVVICEWGTSNEVHFNADGSVVLKKIRVLGGAEPEATVERQGSRIVVTDYSGDEHRISQSEFPIKTDYE